MSLRLILIRHAKSGWDDPELDDHARPLNSRGQSDAPRMGDWLRAEGYVPEVILCSSALRTRQTAEALALGPDPVVLDSLYHASPDRLLAPLGKTEAQSIAIIAHNPGIGDLAARLVATPPDNPRFHSYPTLATTVLDFDATDWRKIGRGTVTAFRTPRDL